MARIENLGVNTVSGYDSEMWKDLLLQTRDLLDVQKAEIIHSFQGLTLSESEVIPRVGRRLFAIGADQLDLNLWQWLAIERTVKNRELK